MRKKLHQLLIDLCLKGMANVLDRELNRAEKKGGAFDEVLYRLLAQELAFARNAACFTDSIMQNPVELDP